MINYYFGSKEKLYLAVLERVYAEIREAEARARPRPPVAGGGDPPHRRVHLQLLRRARRLRAARHGREPGAGAATCGSPQVMRTLNRPIIERSARVIERGQARGRLPPRRRPVEIHKAIAALGMFNVTNQYTFGSIFQRDMGRKGDVDAAAVSPTSAGYRPDSQPRFDPRRKDMSSRRPSHGAQGGRRARRRGLAARLRAGQAEAALRRGVLRQGHPRRDDARCSPKDIEADFTLEPYYGGTLFKQGTELVALQRGNLEMGNIAPQDISKQIPAWSILTSAYLFRDADHLNAFFASDLGARDEEDGRGPAQGARSSGRPIFGTRQVGLKPKKKITTPADMAGIKLRMPRRRRLAVPRHARSAPTRRRWPMPRSTPACRPARSTARTTRCRTSQNMKFYEVMSQIVLTSHLVGFDLLTVNHEDLERHGAGASRRPSRPPPTRRSTGARPST